MLTNTLVIQGKDDASMSYFLDALSSYLVAFGTILLGNMDGILKWGGIILLIVRLVADAPRAYRTVRRWMDGE